MIKTYLSRPGRKVLPGKFYPLGATISHRGVNFALYSQFAQEVYLLLFDKPDGEPTDVIRLEHRTRFIWHAFIQGLKAGQLYGYKVVGEYNASRGMRFNHHKFLLDPYAKAVTGKAVNTDGILFGYKPGEGDWTFDTRDSTRAMPKCIAVDDHFEWRDDAPPDIPMEQLFIYETHLKGFTAHPSSGVKQPGTYLGFIEKIPYLQQLGVNAVEFLPIQEFQVEDMLAQKGLTNYWGYNPVSYFAPESSYGSGSSPGSQVQEFKALVYALHKAGIEVLLDVVYNHTGEGSELGPTLSFRGIDNATYYMLQGGDQDPYRYYVNHSGCGNTLNAGNPAVLRMIMDSLRYWVQEMHVDGFRFDLASTLGRKDGAFQRSTAFFDAISQDPVLNKVKLIAEPWDLGTYQVGNFPVDWSEWNGKFRDTIRQYWRGDAGQLNDLGWRLTGSADLYADDGRSAYNSVNFVTCHDGFTLHDLVSYAGKHNEANRNGDGGGTNDNYSDNCGIEGETDRPEILAMRDRLMKNFFCTLLFSCGTPMLLGGDEMRRTQRGNNNAYCQDNDLSWFDWKLVKENTDLVQFVRKAIALCRRYPVLQRKKFFEGSRDTANGIPDIAWYGARLTPPEWNNPASRLLCYLLNGEVDTPNAAQYFLFIIMNAGDASVAVQLPRLKHNVRWFRVIDTHLPAGDDFLDEGRELLIDPPGRYTIEGRTMAVLAGR